MGCQNLIPASGLRFFDQPAIFMPRSYSQRKASHAGMPEPELAGTTALPESSTKSRYSISHKAPIKTLLGCSTPPWTSQSAFTAMINRAECVVEVAGCLRGRVSAPLPQLRDVPSGPAGEEQWSGNETRTLVRNDRGSNERGRSSRRRGRYAQRMSAGTSTGS